MNGVTSAAQPVIGFNYGAKELQARVRTGIKFMTFLCVGYTTAVWLFVLAFPELLMRIFKQ